MQTFSQCDASYANHLMGNGPGAGSICAGGCLLDCFSMIAWDSFSDSHYSPDGLNNVFNVNGTYMSEGGGLNDLLPDNALDRVWPARYITTHYAGFRADLIAAAIPSPDTYVILNISGYSPLWKMNCFHFVLGWSADGTYILDPEGGVVRNLSAYGGSASVIKTTLVKRITPPPPPPPVPPPAPIVYTVQIGKVVVASNLSYIDAVSQAHNLAQGHVGVVYEVVDAKGNTLETEFRAPTPPPIPAPPIPPRPTPPPVITRNIWDYIDSFLITIILAIKRTPTK